MRLFNDRKWSRYSVVTVRDFTISFDIPRANAWNLCNTGNAQPVSLHSERFSRLYPRTPQQAFRCLGWRMSRLFNLFPQDPTKRSSRVWQIWCSIWTLTYIRTSARFCNRKSGSQTSISFPFWFEWEEWLSRNFSNHLRSITGLCPKISIFDKYMKRWCCLKFEKTLYEPWNVNNTSAKTFLLLHSLFLLTEFLSTLCSLQH